MTDPARLDTMLPHEAPDSEDMRVLLFAFRRFAARGLRDGCAVSRMFAHFGIDARRMLLLLRAYMFEVARSTERNIRLAPCCAPRMTADEHAVIEALAQPQAAQAILGEALGNFDCGRAVEIARALSESCGARGGRRARRPR